MNRQQEKKKWSLVRERNLHTSLPTHYYLFQRHQCNVIRGRHIDVSTNLVLEVDRQSPARGALLSTNFNARCEPPGVLVLAAPPRIGPAQAASSKFDSESV